MRILRLSDLYLSLLLYGVVLSLRFHPEQVDWNLNQNRTAIAPLDYWGQWHNHSRTFIFIDTSPKRR